MKAADEPIGHAHGNKMNTSRAGPTPIACDGVGSTGRLRQPRRTDALRDCWGGFAMEEGLPSGGRRRRHHAGARRDGRAQKKGASSGGRRVVFVTSRASCSSRWCVGRGCRVDRHPSITAGTAVTGSRRSRPLPSLQTSLAGTLDNVVTDDLTAFVGALVRSLGPRSSWPWIAGRSTVASPNHIPGDVTEPGEAVVHSLHRTRGRQPLLRSFFNHVRPHHERSIHPFKDH